MECGTIAGYLTHVYQATVFGIGLKARGAAPRKIKMQPHFRCNVKKLKKWGKGLIVKYATPASPLCGYIEDAGFLQLRLSMALRPNKSCQ